MNWYTIHCHQCISNILTIKNMMLIFSGRQKFVWWQSWTAPAKSRTMEPKLSRKTRKLHISRGQWVIKWLQGYVFSIAPSYSIWFFQADISPCNWVSEKERQSPNTDILGLNRTLRRTCRLRTADKQRPPTTGTTRKGKKILNRTIEPTTQARGYSFFLYIFFTVN